MFFRTAEVDPEMRITMLFSDYKTFLRQISMEYLITDNTKVSVAHVVSLLKQFSLKPKVESDLNLLKRNLKEDWKDFF